MNRRSFMGLLGLAPVCAAGAAYGQGEAGLSGEFVEVDGLPLVSNLTTENIMADDPAHDVRFYETDVPIELLGNIRLGNYVGPSELTALKDADAPIIMDDASKSSFLQFASDTDALHWFPSDTVLMRIKNLTRGTAGYVVTR